MNETLDSERNEIGSVGEDPSNMPRQSNKKEVTYNRKKWTKLKKAVLLKTDRPNEKQVHEASDPKREGHGENKPDNFDRFGGTVSQ
jgi:hypothetical protein